MQLKNFLSDNFSVGKGAIKLPIEDMINGHREAFKTLKKPRVNIFKLTTTNTMVAHVEIPSETVEGFHYDVLLELNLDNAKDYEDCHIKVFSNSPSFVFSYAYVFYHFEDKERGGSNLIVDKYHQKIPKNNLMPKTAVNTVPEEVLTHKPIMRNPLGIPLFDKTVYYAVFALMDQIPFVSFKRNLKLIADRALFLKIEDFEKHMKTRKMLAARMKSGTMEAKVKQVADIKKTMQQQEREHKKESTSGVNVVTARTSGGVNVIKPRSSGGVRKANRIG